jgi:hypothetical protein
MTAGRAPNGYTAQITIAPLDPNNSPSATTEDDIKPSQKAIDFDFGVAS